MRIVHLVPGSGGGFYCENCVRDNALARALLRTGEDVRVVPLYLPPMEDSPAARSGVPIFFGGINVYLQQKSGLFRKTPRWIDRLFDASPLLRWAARRAGSVRASGLGETTLSMLKGMEGNQAKELRRLVEWLGSSEPCDVVHLSNALLLGVGAEIRRRLGVPLVCSLQDEDSWLEAMEEPWRGRCWEALAEAARQADAFTAVSRTYAGIMGGRLGIPPERLHVVLPGIDPEEFSPPPAPPDPPAVGFLGRASESLGLGILAEAFLGLRESPTFRTLRLHVTGGATEDDRPFLKSLQARFADRGAAASVKFYEDFGTAGRREFLRSLSVLSVPAPSGAAFGLYLLESFASGVPAVQPLTGAFPEILEATGAGVLYHPNTPEALAEVLGDLLGDPARRAELGRRGREAVERRFNLDVLARKMKEVYRKVARP